MGLFQVTLFFTYLAVFAVLAVVAFLSRASLAKGSRRSAVRVAWAIVMTLVLFSLSWGAGAFSLVLPAF